MKWWKWKFCLKIHLRFSFRNLRILIENSFKNFEWNGICFEISLQLIKAKYLRHNTESTTMRCINRPICCLPFYLLSFHCGSKLSKIMAIKTSKWLRRMLEWCLVASTLDFPMKNKKIHTKNRKKYMKIFCIYALRNNGHLNYIRLVVPFPKSYTNL